MSWMSWTFLGFTKYQTDAINFSCLSRQTKFVYSWKIYELSRRPGQLFFQPTDGAMMTQLWDPWFWCCTHYICVLHNYMYIILFIWIYKYAPFLTTETNIEFLVVSNNHPHFVEQLGQNIDEVVSIHIWNFSSYFMSIY